LGVRVASLNRKRETMKKRERKAMTSEERDGIISDYKSGVGSADLSAKYMRSESVVHRTLRMAGVPTHRSERKLNGKAAVKVKAVSGSAKVVRRRKRNKKSAGVQHIRVKKNRDTVAHANAALRLSNKRSGSVRHAVIALMKTLEHEEIHELSIDFNHNTFHVKRVLVEEGKV
jgi:hypothetical protein